MLSHLRSMRKLLAVVLIFIGFSVKAQVKVLFDATKAEMSGNGDWVIDADIHNVGLNSSGQTVAGLGDESNPQRIPSPLQSSINSSTPETYWTGALSSWGVDLVRYGFVVETLPIGSQLTYGNTANPLDLSNYKVFIIDEPNILFTTAEKTALLHFVQNGGGLFMISDHDQSDRNFDGYDSPAIWNDLMANNSFQSNPFGITFDLQNYSQSTSNIIADVSDSILHGRAGVPTGLEYNNGTTMTLNRTVNVNAKGLIYKTGATAGGLTNVFFARSTYGSGRVCALGDSSPIDDGTGDPNDQLYSSYASVLSGSHKKLLINAVIWLANLSSLSAISSAEPEIDYEMYPNPVSDILHIHFPTLDQFRSFKLTTLLGNTVSEGEAPVSPSGDMDLPVNGLESGIYFLTVTTEKRKFSKRLIIQ